LGGAGALQALDGGAAGGEALLQGEALEGAMHGRAAGDAGEQARGALAAGVDGAVDEALARARRAGAGAGREAAAAGGHFFEGGPNVDVHQAHLVEGAFAPGDQAGLLLLPVDDRLVLFRIVVLTGDAHLVARLDGNEAVVGQRVGLLPVEVPRGYVEQAGGVLAGGLELGANAGAPQVHVGGRADQLAAHG
jgi:hypothetical protein